MNLIKIKLTIIYTSQSSLAVKESSKLCDGNEAKLISSVASFTCSSLRALSLHQVQVI